MSAIEHTERVRRFYDGFLDRGEMEAADELLAPEVVVHTVAPFPGNVVGREAVKQGFSGFLSGFSNKHTDVEGLIDEADQIVVRHTHHMTHDRPALGLAATGKELSIFGVDIFRFDQGQVVEWWVIDDNLGLLQQLGVVPPLLQPPAG